MHSRGLLYTAVLPITLITYETFWEIGPLPENPVVGPKHS